MVRVKFGIFAPQVGVTFSAIKERVALAERLGFHSFWFMDHFWAKGMPDLDHLEAWTLMSAVAAVTERIGIGTLVVCNSYRNPALVAKMAASLDNISNGRFLLGIGAGWMEEEYRAYGYPFPPIRVRLEQFEEALAVIKRMFAEDRATFQGKYYTIEEAPNNPKPLRKPHPPLLIGGAGERHLLRLVAEHADIWNCPNNAAPELEKKLGVLARHCEAIGRDPATIEVSEQCIVVLARNEKELKEKLQFARGTLGAVFDVDRTALKGTPEQLVEAIHARHKQGVTFFTILFSDFNQPDTLELFAERVAPAFA
ncbi:LLM class F420-dependent oxidoreductase [Candidatus Binatia bacterium]|nr:LLM class F420-dependent oxidoreductase [Candidatus Binatia bacterium]